MSFSGYFPQNSKQFALFRAVFVTDECSTIELHEDWKRKFSPKVQKYMIYLQAIHLLSCLTICVRLFIQLYYVLIYFKLVFHLIILEYLPQI